MQRKSRTRLLALLLAGLAFSGCANKSSSPSEFALLSLFSETAPAPIATSANAIVVTTSDPAVTGCKINVTTTSPTATPGAVAPGQTITFEMEGENVAHVENAGFIEGLPNSIGDLPATHSIIAPDVTTKYVLSVFTVDGVRTRNNNCEVTVTVTAPTAGTEPLPVCDITTDRLIVPYGETFTLSWTAQNAVAAEISPTNAMGVLAAGDIATGSKNLNSWYGNDYSMKVWNADGVSAQCFASIQETATPPTPPATSHLITSSDPADTGCSINVTSTTAPTTPGAVNPGQVITFEMEGENVAHVENSGFITGISNSVGDLPASHSIIAPDVTTNYVLSVLTVDGVRTRDNTCNVTVNVVPATGSTAPLATCTLKTDKSIIPYGESFNLEWVSQYAVAAEIYPTNAVGVLNTTEVATGSRALHSWYGTQYKMKVWNADGVSAQCSVNFKDTPTGNAPPAATDGNYSINNYAVGAMQPLSGQLVATDLESTPLTYEIKTQPTKGTISNFNPATGEFEYSPNPRESGQDSFTFSVNDGTQDSNIASIQIKVKGHGASRLSTGGWHSCYLLDSGKVKCWGRDGVGQLGNDNRNNQSKPVEVVGIPVVVQDGNVVREIYAVQVTSGLNRTCAVMDDSSLYCWGVSIGSKPRRITTRTEMLVNVAEVSIGGGHACALFLDRTVKCWGRNAEGQLGNGNTGTVNNNGAYPEPVIGINNAVQVITGYFHTCALLDTGKMKCWGTNTSGQIGIGPSAQFIPTPTYVLQNSPYTHISAGNAHTCAVLDIGEIECWGSGYFGELGNDSPTQTQRTPVRVTNISNAIQVTAGFYQTCALLDDGTLKCWGYGNHGQIGNADNLDQHSPVAVSNANNVRAVSCGITHVCALDMNDNVKCWGDGQYGNLGNGNTVNSNIPVDVINLQ